MAIAERRTPEETRSCILAVAWDLFRQLGARTTMADIAEKLGMSSANVYRFFSSKQALNEAVCEGLLGELLKAARRELDAPGTASQRIAGMMLTIHRLMRDQMTDHARVHEVVQIACDEVWPPIVDYLHKCAAMLADVIAVDWRVRSRRPEGTWLADAASLRDHRESHHDRAGPDDPPGGAPRGRGRIRFARALEQKPARTHPGDLSS
jgi:AcrR family transcriptional regulator